MTPKGERPAGGVGVWQEGPPSLEGHPAPQSLGSATRHSNTEHRSPSLYCATEPLSSQNRTGTHHPPRAQQGVVKDPRIQRFPSPVFHGYSTPTEGHEDLETPSGVSGISGGARAAAHPGTGAGFQHLSAPKSHTEGPLGAGTVVLAGSAHSPRLQAPVGSCSPGRCGRGCFLWLLLIPGPWLEREVTLQGTGQGVGNAGTQPGTVLLPHELVTPWDGSTNRPGDISSGLLLETNSYSKLGVFSQSLACGHPTQNLAFIPRDMTEEWGTPQRSPRLQAG